MIRYLCLISDVSCIERIVRHVLFTSLRGNCGKMNFYLMGNVLSIFLILRNAPQRRRCAYPAGVSPGQQDPAPAQRVPL